MFKQKKSTSHIKALTKGIHKILRYAQSDRGYQAGRSMVEMLGVLAVMGLISITGLMGYTYAMKRHQVNELINEANKRAVVASTQLMAGKRPEDVTLDEFPEDEHFTNSIVGVGDKFKMTIKGVDQSACDLIKNLSGGVIRQVNCKDEEEFTVELLFNNDLSTEERPSDYATEADCKSPYKWCSGLGTTGQCSDNTNCCFGITLNQCQKSCDSDTGTITNKDDGESCDYTTIGAADGTCQEGVCVEIPTCSATVGDPCDNNSTVCLGYYCALTIGTFLPDSETGYTWCGNAEYTPGSGRVVSLGEPKTNFTPYAKFPYLASPDEMTWHAAVNYCDALKATVEAGVTVNGVDYSEYKEYTLSGRLAQLPNECPKFCVDEVACSTDHLCSSFPRDDSYWLNDLIQWDCYTENYSTTYGSKSCAALAVTGGIIHEDGGLVMAVDQDNLFSALCE